MKASVLRWPVLGVVCLAAAAVALHGAPADLPVMDGVPTAEPETVGMSTERLERLDRVMQAYIDREEVAGVVTLVARRGKVVNFSALGQRDVEHGKAMAHDTIFRMASMTKPIASVALMMLYEEGHFQLRDPISKWLPEFADMQVATPRRSRSGSPDATSGFPPRARSPCSTCSRTPPDWPTPIGA